MRSTKMAGSKEMARSSSFTFILFVLHLYFHSYNKRRLLDNGRQADIQQSFLIFSKIKNTTRGRSRRGTCETDTARNARNKGIGLVTPVSQASRNQNT